VRRFALAVIALATVPLAAQPTTRRATNLGALVTHPGFYHLHPIVIVGKVATTDAGLRISNDSGSVRLIAKGSAPDGVDEVRGEFWDIGRMKPDEPRLASYDLKRTFNVDPEGAWPRPGDVTVIVASSVTAAQVPSTPTIRAVVLDPERYRDQKMTLTGQFAGRNLFGDLPDAPGLGRFDFVIRSADAAIWVTGAQPKGRGFNLSVDARIDTNRWLEIAGTVRERRGLQWLETTSDGIQLGKPPSETTRDEPEPIRVPAAPPPEVVFSTPTQDETDVSMSTTVRVQFSRDIDPSTLKGHIVAHYLESQTVERGEPTTPSAEFTTQYNAASRVLELKFTKPLERFRTILVELTGGILGTDKQPLKPWTLRFDLGGA